jgi:TetR/AcrR family transcriptional regulator, cholesterol catabolism regulator
VAGDNKARQFKVTRERLVSIAGDLFAERGYRATTLDDVAEVLEVKKASIYYYIDSKNDLLCEIYDQILGRISEQVLPIADLDVPADERLRRMVNEHMGFVASERNLLAVVFQEESELPDERQAQFRAQKRRYEDGFEQVVQEGQAAGLLREGSSRLMVLAMLGMANWMYQWHDPARHDTREIVGEFVQILERGWLTSDRPARAAWPRADSVDDALSGVVALAHQTQGAIEALRAELEFAKRRLEDGVISHTERNA